MPIEAARVPHVRSHDGCLPRVEYIEVQVPDAEERLRRAYTIILRAAQRAKKRRAPITTSAQVEG